MSACSRKPFDSIARYRERAGFESSTYHYNSIMDSKPLAKSVEVDAQQFKMGMRSLAGAVNIITSAHAGHRYGMTATAVCSASAEPPTVLVCVNKLATTHGAIARGRVFCVNVRRADDWALSTTFSGAQS